MECTCLIALSNKHLLASVNKNAPVAWISNTAAQLKVRPSVAIDSSWPAKGKDELTSSEFL